LVGPFVSATGVLLDSNPLIAIPLRQRKTLLCCLGISIRAIANAKHLAIALACAFAPIRRASSSARAFDENAAT